MSSLLKKAAEVVKETVQVAEKEAKAIVGPAALVTEAKVVEEMKSEFADSATLLEEARNGRNISDIPMDDVYWMVQREHTLVHGKHSLRTDELDTVKGKPVKK